MEDHTDSNKEFIKRVGELRNELHLPEVVLPSQPSYKPDIYKENVTRRSLLVELCEELRIPEYRLAYGGRIPKSFIVIMLDRIRGIKNGNG